VVERKPDQGTATNPELYDIREVSDYFRHLLFERDDLFMKVTPLYELEHGGYRYKRSRDLQEIYNEIVAAYFLGELLYGYSQVLSLHFMAIVDWFPALKKEVVTGEGETQDLLHQIVVIERLDQTLDDYLTENPTIEVLRAVLFQIFHAMETAWHTHGYIHQDLHSGNVMLQRMPQDSPLFEKDFLYRRLSSPHWYRVGKDALRNNLVKIIDFGRNRLLVPSEPAHIQSGGDRRHIHDRLVHIKVYSESYGSTGVLNLLADRHCDVATILHSIKGHMPDSYWEDMGEDGTQSFLALYGRTKGKENSHKVASDALDDPFFDAYRTEAILPERELTDEEVLSVRDSHVVVSFLANPAEADLIEPGEMHLDAKRGLSQCSVCRSQQRGVTLRVGDSELLCAKSCYEFKYLFGEKTVFR
jgi:hypothetical protein